MIRRLEQQMIVSSDQGFHAKADDPANLKVCAPKTWPDHMVIETVFSMLTRRWGFKQQTYRAWAYFKTHLRLAVATFNLLTQWHGWQPDKSGSIKLSMAQFSLQPTSTSGYADARLQLEGRLTRTHLWRKICCVLS